MCQRITVNMECPNCNKINSIQLISIDIKRHTIENRLGSIGIIPSSMSTCFYKFYKCSECNTMFKDMYNNKTILSLTEFFKLF